MGIIIGVGSTDLTQVLANQQVPAVDGTGNITINQLLGNRNDGNNTTTIYALLNDMWEDGHHNQKLYPDLAAPVTVTSHTDAYTLGDFAEIVPANAIGIEFHIHHLHLSSPDANGQYILALYVGIVEIARTSFSRTDKKDDVEGLDIRIPHIVANAQIQAKLATSNAAQQDDVDLRLWYHPH